MIYKLRDLPVGVASAIQQPSPKHRVKLEKLLLDEILKGNLPANCWSICLDVRIELSCIVEEEAK